MIGLRPACHVHRDTLRPIKNALPARCSPFPQAALGQIGIFALPLPSISDASLPCLCADFQPHPTLSSPIYAVPLVGSPPPAVIQLSSSRHPAVIQPAIHPPTCLPHATSASAFRFPHAGTSHLPANTAFMYAIHPGRLRAKASGERCTQKPNGYSITPSFHCSDSLLYFIISFYYYSIL